MKTIQANPKGVRERESFTYVLHCAMVLILVIVHGQAAQGQIPTGTLGRVVQVTDSLGVLSPVRPLIYFDSTGLNIDSSAGGHFKVFGNTPATTHLNMDEGGFYALNQYRFFGLPGGADAIELRFGPGDTSRYWINNALSASTVPFAFYNVGPRRGDDSSTGGGTKLCFVISDDDLNLTYTPGEPIRVYGDLAYPIDSSYAQLGYSPVFPFISNKALLYRLRIARGDVPDDQTTFTASTDGYQPQPGTVIRFADLLSDTIRPVIVVTNTDPAVTYPATGARVVFPVKTISYVTPTLEILSAPPGAWINADGDLEWVLAGEQPGLPHQISLRAINPTGAAQTDPFTVSKPLVTAARTDANNVEILTHNDGRIGSDAEATQPGFTFRGYNPHDYFLLYAAGFILGGRDPDGNLRLLLSTYASDFQPGPILNSGVNPSQLIAGNPLSDSSNLFVLPDDFDIWPSTAPRDTLDQPLQVSAEDTWMVFNDLDSTRYQEPSTPMGLEVQRQTYQFPAGVLDNAVIVRMRIVNKSNITYHSVYLCLWNDTNVGAVANDDVSGVDSALSLFYNYSTSDPMPWASGLQWLQGPLVEDSGHVATILRPGTSGFYWEDVYGQRLMSASSAFRHPNGTGPSNNQEFYWILEGLDYDGQPKPLGPFDLLVTSPANARGYLSSGPFTFVAGDTQDVFYALIGSQGVDHADAVAHMLAQAQTLQGVYHDRFIVDVAEPSDDSLLRNFSLFANYPNPFNPSTTIKYVLPKQAKVSLKVYNILGQEVRTLVNAREGFGEHTVVWNGKNQLGRPVSSGVYLYRLDVDGKARVRKMMLIR